MRETLTIKDKAAAAAFAAALPRTIIQTLIGEEMTLAELSRAIETPLNLLHYHVSKGVSLGLIAVVRKQARAGRAAKVYRATAKTFFVPADLLVEMPGTDMSRQLRAALDGRLVKSLKGVNFSHDGEGPLVRLIKDPAARATTVELWLDVKLSSADAAELKSDFEALLDRYRLRRNEKEARYLVHLAAAKL